MGLVFATCDLVFGKLLKFPNLAYKIEKIIMTIFEKWANIANVLISHYSITHVVYTIKYIVHYRAYLGISVSLL